VGVAPVYLNEDESYPLGTVSLSDVDDDFYSSDNLLSLMISTEHGIITSSNSSVSFLLETIPAPSLMSTLPLFSPPHNKSSSKNSSSTVNSTTATPSIPSVFYRVQGSSDLLNEVLSYLIYRPITHFFGNDSLYLILCSPNPGLSVVTADATHSLSSSQEPTQCSSKTIPFIISGVNDSPRWVAPTAPFVTGEDEAFSFSGAIAVVDVDAFDLPIFVQLSVDYGVLSLSRGALPSSITLLRGTGDNDREIQMRGALFEINIALQGLVYIPPPHWNSGKHYLLHLQ